MKPCILILLLSFSLQLAQANDHAYLRIVIDKDTDVSYPPNSGFILQDENENNVLTFNQLKEIGQFEITQPYTLFVFVSWKDEPDVYNLTTGTLYAEKQNINNAWKNTSKTETRNPYVYNRERFTKGLEIIRSRFFDFDGKNFDASIEFNNDVVFYYRNGKAEAWQNGKALNIEGKYLISTDEGLIKLSYNPQNKKVWYVFEPKTN